jgi:hypothetical protein
MIWENVIYDIHGFHGFHGFLEYVAIMMDVRNPHDLNLCCPCHHWFQHFLSWSDDTKTQDSMGYDGIWVGHIAN